MGGENKYLFVFPRGSNELSYGHADGYVADLCGHADDLVAISTEPAPAPTSCRTCKFCASDWDSGESPAGGGGGAGGAGGAGSGLPDCVFDQDGNISLPAP